MPGTTGGAAPDVSDRELLIIRVFDAPQELVWRAWTDPHHIAQWWGPNGFTTTTSAMDVRPGGKWRFVMHGPDGTDYQNTIAYLEVEPPSRLVYQHTGGEGEPVSFRVTVTLDAEGTGTRLTMRMLFPSAAEFQRVNEKYRAVEGAYQTIGRLEAYVTTMGTDN
jgi:uncharacterized protein YndB with AHSA1/START domain